MVNTVQYVCVYPIKMVVCGGPDGHPLLASPSAGHMMVPKPWD